MIAFISLCYASLYILIFNKFKWLEKTAGNIAAFAGVGVVLVGAIVFSWYTFSPMSGDARTFRYITPVVPYVEGHVTNVPVQPMAEVRKGTTLFEIDPSPYEHKVAFYTAEVEKLRAEHRLAEINLTRAKELLKTQATAQIDVDRFTAESESAAAAIGTAIAKLDDAQYELQKTLVKAPSDGYAVNVQLRPGDYVTPAPSDSPMAFISIEDNQVVASFSQSAGRLIEKGDQVELFFSMKPGEVHGGKVVEVVRMGSDSQLMPTADLPEFTGAASDDRWIVRVHMDDEQLARDMPQGAAGTMAVYTNKGKPFHIISKVALRMNGWLGYLTSP